MRQARNRLVQVRGSPSAMGVAFVLAGAMVLAGLIWLIATIAADLWVTVNAYLQP